VCFPISRQHYIEYLVRIIGQNKVDPASIFDGAEALLELTRRGKDAPQRAASMSDEDYRLLCVKVTNTLLTPTGLHLVMVASHGNWKADVICLVFHLL